ncbi:MAG: hypothetical protein ACIAQF_04090 [Phycisphaerales bacterium JB065]
MADHTPNNPNPHPQQPTQLPDGLSDAARIRAIADGELAPGETGDASGVAFERELRQAVARAMSEPQAAPAGLRESILARLEQEAQEEPIPFAEAKPTRDAGIHRSSLFSGFLPRLMAIAAVLILSTAAIYLGAQQFASTPSNLPTNGQGLNLQTVSSQLQFVQKEHNRCSDISTGNFTSKIKATDPDDARAFAESRLGCGGARLADAIERMRASGYEFIGVGACSVPGGGKSVHALFTPTQWSDKLHPVSLFLLESPGAGCKDAKAGVCYSCPKAKQEGKPSMMWRDENLIVFIHADSPQSIDVARTACHAPDAVKSL